METKQKNTLILFILVLVLIITLSLGNFFSIMMTVVEGKLPHGLEFVYNRLYNLVDYAKQAFNPPLWERKIYTRAEVPPENLKTTKLPIFDLYIAEEDIHQLNARIPRTNAFVRNNPVYHSNLWVPGKFKFNEEVYDIKVKHRGTGWWHWRVPKKSMRIKFPKGTSFYGTREINLINAKYIVPYIQLIEYHLAGWMGLIAPNAYMVHLRLNDKYYGIMFAFDQPDKLFLQNNNRPQGDIYGEKGPWTSLFTDTKYWEKYCEYDESNPNDFGNLKKFLSVLKIEDRELFKDKIKDILDLDTFYRWYAHSVILASAHQDTHNIRIYYDPVKRIFEFIPWDVMTMNEGFRSLDYAYNNVIAKILSYPEFGYQKNLVLWEITKDDRILNKILNLIDELDYATREDIFCDKDRSGWAFKDHDYYDYYYRYPASKYEKEVGYLKKYYINRFDFIRKELEDCKVKAYIEKKEKNYYLHIISYGQIGYKAQAIRFGLNNDDEVEIPLNITIFPERCVDLSRSDKNVEFLPKEVTVKIEFEKYLDNITPATDIKTVKLVGENSVTERPIVLEIAFTEGVYDFDINSIYPFDVNTARFLERWPMVEKKSAVPEELKVVTLKKGVHNIESTLMITKDELLVIEPGAEIMLYPGASVIIYGGIIAKGTREEPIVFTGKNGETWGSVVIDRSTFNDNMIDFCNFSLGSMTKIEGIEYAGMLSIENTDALITNSTFEQAKGEDGINANYSNSTIKNCMIKNCSVDGIDFNFCSGTIEDSAFISNGGDAIDFSFCTTTVLSCNISKSGDKGVSVGEKSNILLDGLTISDCDIGIAVKDSSFAQILNSSIMHNRLGIAVYKRKPTFGGAETIAKNTTVWYNDKNISTDEFSKIKIENPKNENGGNVIERLNTESEILPKNR